MVRLPVNSDPALTTTSRSEWCPLCGTRQQLGVRLSDGDRELVERMRVRVDSFVAHLAVEMLKDARGNNGADGKRH